MTESLSHNNLEQIGSIYYKQNNKIPAIGETIIIFKDGGFIEAEVIDHTTLQKEIRINDKKAYVIVNVPIIKGPNYTSIIVFDYADGYSKESISFWECQLEGNEITVPMGDKSTLVGNVERVMLRGDFPYSAIAIVRKCNGDSRTVLDLKQIKVLPQEA